MNQTLYRNRTVRSPIQYRPPHRQNSKIVPNQEDAILDALKKLCCARYNLSVTFSPDTGLMEELKTPGLIVVRCELSLDGKGLIGIGHGSTVVDGRLARGVTRALFSCLNGSLLSAINVGCKSLDVHRLEAAEEEAASERGLVIQAHRAREATTSEIEPASERQKAFLRDLIGQHVSDEEERQNRINALEDMSKEEASIAIAEFSQ